MINIFKLNKKRDQKNLNKEFIFRTVLRRIHNKIESRGEKGAAQTIYVIPRVILGLPTYDQIKCASYCVNKLRSNGFIIVYTYPNLLFISWDHVPSTLKNPEYKVLAYEILTKPDRDYSEIIQNLANTTTIKQIEY